MIGQTVEPAFGNSGIDTGGGRRGCDKNRKREYLTAFVPFVQKCFDNQGGSIHVLKARRIPRTPCIRCSADTKPSCNQGATAPDSYRKRGNVGLSGLADAKAILRGRRRLIVVSLEYKFNTFYQKIMDRRPVDELNERGGASTNNILK